MEGNGTPTRRVLSRAHILDAIDLTVEMVDVHEWGDEGDVVYVRNLTGAGRDRFEGSRYRMVGERVELVHENTRARLCAETICDAEGSLLFSLADVQRLGEKNAAPLDRCFDVAQRLSGLRPKDIEAKLKNFVTAPSDNSISASP